MNRNIMIQAGFADEVRKVQAGLCPTCGEEITRFRNELSKREFKISRMCQSCQDSVFGKD